MNILVLAYQLSPTKGSEYSVAWNYVQRMSKYHHLTVIYGVSGTHLGDCSEMKNYIKEKGGIHNVVFIDVQPNKWVNLLNWCNRHNFFNYTFYFAYHEWQKQVYGIAKRLHDSEHFDLIHFVGPTGYREPGYLWNLDIPYVWGPIGGANSNSMILAAHLPLMSKMKFWIRNVLNHLQLKYQRRLRKAVKNTDLLLTATSENQKIFKSLLNKTSRYLPENAITNPTKLDQEKFKTPDKFHFVFVGSLIPRKALNILLEALVLITNKDRIVVDIVGDGPMRAKLMDFAQLHNIDGFIRWHGQLPRPEAVAIFGKAHMHVITSTSEGNPTTIWEAMSYGVPTMSFDHCGMHDTICDKCGILIPIHTYDQCVHDLAKEIDNLIDHPERFKQLAEGVLQCAKKYSWDKREKIILDCYDAAIKNHNSRCVK